MEAGVAALVPDIAAGHDRDGVLLALIFAHQHGAGLEAPIRQLVARRETVQDLGGLRIEPAKSLFLDVPADEAGDEVLRVRFKTWSRVTKLSQHEADGGKFQEREGVAVEIFPILGEPATTIEPCDGSFDDPTLG